MSNKDITEFVSGADAVADFAANYNRTQQVKNQQYSLGVESSYVGGKSVQTIQMGERDVSPFKTSNNDYCVGAKGSFSNLG